MSEFEKSFREFLDRYTFENRFWSYEDAENDINEFLKRWESSFSNECNLPKHDEIKEQKYEEEELVYYPVKKHAFSNLACIKVSMNKEEDERVD